jgi:hypothetical protein
MVEPLTTQDYFAIEITPDMMEAGREAYAEHAAPEPTLQPSARA